MKINQLKSSKTFNKKRKKSGKGLDQVWVKLPEEELKDKNQDLEFQLNGFEGGQMPLYKTS